MVTCQLPVAELIARSVPTSQGFYIECDGVIAATVVEWVSVATSPPTSSPPSLNFTIDATQRVTGQPVKLSWTTTGRGSLPWLAWREW